jgi:hypothetical protein
MMNRLFQLILATLAAVAGIGIALVWWQRQSGSSEGEIPVVRPDGISSARNKQEKRGFKRLKEIAIELGSNDEGLRRDLTTFLLESKEGMSPDEQGLLRDSSSPDAEFQSFAIGRKVCEALSNGFNAKAACVAWDGHAKLAELRNEMIEVLGSPADVQQAKGLIRQLSNYAKGLKRMGDLDGDRYGISINHTKMLWFADGLTRLAGRDEFLPQRDGPSRIPVFSLEDGYVLKALKYCLAEHISVPFGGKEFSELRGELSAGGLPHISESSFEAIKNKIHSERDKLIQDLEKQRKSTARVNDDYQYFEEFFRILARKPTESIQAPLEYRHPKAARIDSELSEATAVAVNEIGPPSSTPNSRSQGVSGGRV